MPDSLKVPLAPTPATVATAARASAKAGHKGLIWLVAAAFFMQALDSTIVNTAVPGIASALGVTPLSMRSALTTYVLTLAIFIPASPWLCDRFGTRRVFGAAIAVFALGSLLCGLAQSLPQLVGARVVQGLGGAALMPVGRYVLVRTIERKDFVSSMTTVATFGLIGSVLGPLLGGVLVQYTSWRAIFLINVPVSLLGLYLNRRQMPDYRLTESRRFDTLGFVLFGGASAMLLLASEKAGGVGEWGKVAMWSAVAVLLGFLYVLHSRRTEFPVTDLKLLKVRSVAVALAGNLFTRLGVSGMFLLLVLFLQLGCGWSPSVVGLMMVPQALGAIAVKWVVNRLLLRLGYRRLLLGNTVAVSLMLASFTLVGPQTPLPLIALQVFAYGAFMSLQYSSMNTLAYVDLDVSHASMASSMASTAQYLSMSFGIALASLLMEAFLAGHEPAQYVHAFRCSILILAAMTLAASWIFSRLRKDRPVNARTTDETTSV